MYDNEVKAREYMSYISENAGGFVCAGRDGKIYIKDIGEDKVEIPLNLFKTYKFGEEYKVSKVAYENGIESFKFGNDSRNTLWLNQDNIFITDEEQVEKIYNKLKDLTINSFEGTTIIDPTIDMGDMLIIDGKPVIYQAEMSLNGRFIADINSKISIKQKQETTTKQVSQKLINRRVQSRINEEEGKITQLIEENQETSNKLSEHEQTINSIKDTVEKIEDYTREINENNQIHLEKTPEGQGYILEFKIKGSTDNFIYLAPSPTLVPSETLVPLGEHFTLICDKQNRAAISEEAIEIDIKLPEPLRDLNGTYDELNIVDGKTTVTRRIGVDEDLNLYILSEPIIEQLQDIILKTFDENTYIYIKEYRNLNYSAKYIIKSDYSDNFITKVEANSKIEQTSESITEEVNKKVDESEFGTKIEQNWEHVKYAWNQISEFIQMMILNDNVSFAILDENNNALMSLDKKGQHFYKNRGKNIFGEMGVKTVDDQNYISFSVPTDYDKKVQDGMAWGVTTTSDDKFWPILYIKDFLMPPEGSDGCTGKLVLNGCDLELGAINSGILSNGLRMQADAMPGIFFSDTSTGEMLFSIIPQKSIINASVNILDQIQFFRNQSGSNSFKIGTTNNYVLMTDEGDLHVMGGYILFGTKDNRVDFSVYPDSLATIYGSLDVDGNVYADNISSDKRQKKNIKNSQKNALDIIKQIKHKEFEMKKDNKHYDIGYIAQEMEKIDPNFVIKREKTKDSEERYYMNELPIIATATKAIQEQQEQIEELQQQIEVLKENDKQKDEIISDLIKRIETLEQEAKNEKESI